MAGGNKAIRPEDNTNGFQKNPQNINKEGRPASIKRALRELMDGNGVMKIEKKNVISINKDGSVEVKIPSDKMAALKLNHWMMSNKENASLKAIEMIMSHLDGRPNQSIDLSIGTMNIDPKEFIGGDSD